MQVVEYYIILQIKTPDGFEPYGKFATGQSLPNALNIFNQLKGNSDCSFTDYLQIDLISVNNQMPRHLKMMSCSLEDIAENCRIVTREIFKLRNMET